MLARTSLMRWAASVAVVLLVAGGNVVASEYWLAASEDGTIAIEESTVAVSPKVWVTDQGLTGFELVAGLSGFRLEPVSTKGGQFVLIDWPECALRGEIGEPMLPVIRRLVAAPQNAEVVLTVREGRSLTIDTGDTGFPLKIMPKQAPVPKLPGAQEAAPFDYNIAAYSRASDTPEQRAIITEAGVVRGQRLLLLEVNPVSYNPSTQTVTYYPDLIVNVSFDGDTQQGRFVDVARGVRNTVVNPSIVPQAGPRSGGHYVVIIGNGFSSTIAPFVTAKQAQGYTVTTYDAAAGVTNTTIKSYISGLWSGANPPDYILLVGDTDKIPHWVGGGEGSPDTDLPYACMDGSSDWFPDIPIGRFSARTTAELQAIIDKTLYYENGPLADPTYLTRAVFMASQDNASITEGTHNYVIDTHMTPNGYTSTKLYYDDGATTQQVRDAFNAGVFYGIYSGHGGTTSWADGPPFSVSDVNGLTNTDMYPFVCSFACVTGSYVSTECFTETWIRAANKGALAIYGSSVNSYWTEDDVLERRLFDAIFDADDSVPSEVGPVWQEALVRFVAEMGTDATSRRYHEMYNLMGDPSLRFPGACSDAGTVVLDKTKYRFGDTVAITVNDCGLNTDDGVVNQVTVDIDSDSDPGQQVVLVETDPASAEFAGTILVDSSSAPGVLLVADEDTITVTYIDADDGAGGTNVQVTGTATVDMQVPLISQVRAIDIGPRAATITLDADEPVQMTVYYGDSCAALTETAAGSGFATSPIVSVADLDPEERYYYTVEATDEAGNVATSDNGGVCYSFMTPSIPNFFTQLFESGDAFDLANRKLTFTPNGTYDYYAGCVDADPITELPTDPSTGTVLVLTDDSYASLTLTGGKTIPFFGANYSEFFPVSNGYLSFVHGVTDYSETLDEHFSGVPKICALYDDLNPADGGTISWEQFSDRVVVTWDSVPQHSTSGDSNTFQIEMFFDGTITISYLEIGAVDGLAGLSRGEGMDPDFEETDLSAMSDCGPQRPLAFDDNVSLPANGSLSIELPGRDDGLPDPPAAVDYIITALPSHGDLSDPGSGAITAVPYILASNGNVVDYTPEEDYYGSDSLKFKLNDGGVAPDGGDSDEATISIGVIANPPTTQNVSVDLDMNGSATVHLLGNDIDGDDLDYTIMSLPQHGVLSDPSGGAITSTPYTLLGGGEDVLYTAEADYAGADVFMYYASDEIFNSTASTVSLQVIAPAPVITTSVLADGLVLESYGPVQLEVSGGQPTVQWQLVTEQIYAETDLGQSNFGEVGVAKGWHKDEGFWYYFMPFAFPFYGEEYSLIRIRPNGFIDFGSFDGSASENSVTSLINNRMIALLWDDLKTTGTGEDMFIDESVSGSVTIRWRASTYAGDSALNISLTLVDDGTIYFDYGSGNTNVAATVGVSDGDGVHYTVGSYDGLTDLGGLNSVRFHVPLLLPGGMGLSSTGILSGVPAETGDFEPVFKVTDSLGRSDQKVIALHITDFVAGDCDYDGDGDVDLADYAGFQSCYGDTGSPACSMFHSNDDGVIDLVDFAAFALEMDDN